MMMRFCYKDGDKVSDWYELVLTSVEDFVDGAKIKPGTIWCFVENEHVYIFDEDGLYERPDLPYWVPDELYPEYDF